jgi:hypothetical protein
METVGESADESGHGRMPGTVEPKGEHFSKGLIGRPVIESDAVSGDENARAVFAKFAMNKNILRRNVAEQREEFRKLCGSRRGESADGNGNEVNAEGFRL